MLTKFVPEKEQNVSKVATIKTRRPKNLDNRQISARLAQLAGCTPRHVNYILEGGRGKRSKTAQRIREAAEIIMQGYEDAWRKAEKLFEQAA